MGAPNVVWSEAQSLAALREALTLVVCPPNGPVAPVDVYRGRPAATSATRGLAVWYLPTTPVPVDDSWEGEESRAKQKQKVQVVVGAPVQPASSFLLFGQVASYPTQPGDGPAVVAAGLLAAVLALGLPVTAAVVAGPGGAPAVQVVANTPGASMNVQVLAGNLSKVTVDDNVRMAAYNWSSWTIRVVCQDVVDKAGASRASALCEKVRRSLQATSVPLTNGVAYKYLRDVLADGNMAFEQVLNVFALPDALDDGVWVRRASLDVVFRPSTGMTYDVPSLDTVGLAPGTPTLLDPAP